MICELQSEGGPVFREDNDGAHETVTQVCLHLTVNSFKESDALWPDSETLVSLTTPLFSCLFFLQSGPVVDSDQIESSVD